MRVNQIDCPKCGTASSRSRGPVGKSLACPKCRHKFTVQVPDDADVIDDADVVDDDRPSPRRRVRRRPPRREAGRLLATRTTRMTRTSRDRRNGGPKAGSVRATMTTRTKIVRGKEEAPATTRRKKS